MKSFLKNYRQSPRKVRLMADAIRRKDVETATLILKTVPKRAAVSLEKLLRSAVANAKQKGVAGDLFVKDIRVDAGPTLKRVRPRARGSAYPIRKRTSRIMLVLGSKQKNSKEKTKIK